MALNDLQKHEIIRHLGWAAKSLLTDSTHYNSVIVSRLTNLNSTIEAQVAGVLSRLDAIEKQLDSARCRLTASEVGDIVTNENEIPMLRKEYWKWLRQLSDLIDIEIIRSKNDCISVVV